MLDKEKVLVYLDSNHKPDHSRTNYVYENEFYDDLKVNRFKFIWHCLTKKRFFFWLIESLKYALRMHDSIRGTGASDVIMLLSEDAFHQIWEKKNE
jgi:hypothetical protein